MPEFITATNALERLKERLERTEKQKAALRDALDKLLMVPEVRKAAANWATDELIAARHALADAERKEGVAP